jgi:hypothetical protein
MKNSDWGLDPGSGIESGSGFITKPGFVSGDGGIGCRFNYYGSKTTAYQILYKAFP